MMDVRILQVGGIREKLLAAKRAGVRTIVLPGKNSTDVKEVPPEILNGLEILTIENLEEIIGHVLT